MTIERYITDTPLSIKVDERRLATPEMYLGLRCVFLIRSS